MIPHYRLNIRIPRPLGCFTPEVELMSIGLDIRHPNLINVVYNVGSQTYRVVVDADLDVVADYSHHTKISMIDLDPATTASPVYDRGQLTLTFPKPQVDAPKGPDAGRSAPETPWEPSHQVGDIITITSSSNDAVVLADSAAGRPEIPLTGKVAKIDVDNQEYYVDVEGLEYYVVCADEDIINVDGITTAVDLNDAPPARDHELERYLAAMVSAHMTKAVCLPHPSVVHSWKQFYAENIQGAQL